MQCREPKEKCLPHLPQLLQVVAKLDTWKPAVLGLEKGWCELQICTRAAAQQLQIFCCCLHCCRQEADLEADGCVVCCVFFCMGC